MDNNADKLRKKVIRDQQKRLKPGECQKYVRLVVDRSLFDTALGQELLTLLNADRQLSYNVRNLAESQCIVWERSVGQRTLANANEANTNMLNDEWEMERQVVRLINYQELQEVIKKDALPTMGEQLRAAFPDMQYTIIVLRDKQNHNYDNRLIDLAVMQQINIVQLPVNAHEVLALLRRYTKSIAEIPFKLQKYEILGGFKKYLANDKKQCVRVEGTQGFGRLWQQHLNRLPMVTLEVAETVIERYSCPKQLLKEYQRNPTQANQIIADLKIKRSGAVQALQTVDRRIGNVLSTKLHTLYNARDPNALI